jgi:ABC-type Zn uptake system ZnuABC Zn-binding protein ZnuA
LLGNNPENELGISELAQAFEEIREENLQYLLQDGEVSTDLIDQVKSQTGVEVIDYETMERTPRDYQQKTYQGIQLENLAKLKLVMGCQD